MTPLSPAAMVCLRHLRDLMVSLDALRGTHDQSARVKIIREIRDTCDKFLRLTTH